MNMIPSNSEFDQPTIGPSKIKSKSTNKRQNPSLLKIFRPFFRIWIKIFKFTVLTFIEIIRTILQLMVGTNTKKS